MEVNDTKHFMSAQNYKNIGLAVVAGLILGLSQPLYVHGFIDVTPLQSYLGLLAFIGYVPFFWAIAEQNLKRTFMLSTMAIAVHHIVALYWIYIALHVHGHIEPVPAAIITVLLGIILGVMGAIFMTLGRYLSTRFAISFFYVAPLAICASEFFRNYYLFGGFPWGNVGYSLGRITEIAQTASLIGVYGLVFFAAVVNACFCFALQQRKQRGGKIFASIALMLIFSSYVFGVYRLRKADSEYAPSIRVALLQGNISQEVKRQARLHASDILQIYQNLVRRAKAAGAELVVWPESSYPKMVNKDTKDFSFAFEDRVASIIGVVVYGDIPETNDYYVHNSGFITDFRGDIITRYDKSHLVPFGEYVPWPMSGVVDRIVPGLGAFRPGVAFVPSVVKLSESKQISVGTTVCYEGIFPEIARAYAQDPAADMLVNLTNDAWYGFSSAPFQHLLMYRLRSVESGLPFVRATNTGISAWVDVYGREHQTTQLFERDVVIADVPLIKKKTLYAYCGDVIAKLCLLLLLIGYIAAVLPVHQFVRSRAWSKLFVMGVLTSVAIASTLYFHRQEFLAEEAARTKNLFIVLLCLLLMIGLLSKSKRSRSILLTVATVILFVSISLAIFESLYFLFGIALGLLIYLLAFRIKENTNAK